MSTTPAPPRARRGLALLMALVAVMLVSTAVIVGLRGASEATNGLETLERERALRHLLRQGETLAARWAMTQGADMVLAPDARGRLIVDDRFRCRAEVVTLRVLVCDALATPAAEQLPHLRAWLPGSLPPLPRSAALTWDQLAAATTQRHFPDLSNWPGRPRDWSMDEAPAPTRRPTTAAEPDLLLGTNPGAESRVNLNTAPIWLLEALAAQGRISDPDPILRARRAGQRWEVTPTALPEETPGLRPVLRTDRWFAVIRATWGGNQRTWGVLLVGNRDGCRMVSRHDADR